MAIKEIARGGRATVTIPASSKLALFSYDDCQVYLVAGYPNVPPNETLSFSVTGGIRKITTAYSAETVVKIQAGNSPVLYEVGTSPEVDNLPISQPTPTAKTTAATLTIAELLTKILTGTHTAGATAAYTLPTGTLTDAGVSMSVDDAFDWSLINLSAAAVDTITLTAGTDHSIVGNPIVQSAHASTGGIYGNSARWRTRKTAANTFVTYRIA